MRSFKIIVENTREMNEFRGLINVYQEIAAGKLRLIKTAIITNRDFYEGLRKLSLEVGSDFQSALKRESPKEAALFISASQGFYGEIVEKTFQLYLAYIRTHPTENFICGRVGEELMRQYAKDMRFSSLSLADDLVGSEFLSSLLSQLISFHKISVFYGQFQNIVVQEPRVGEISGKLFPHKEEDLRLLAKKRMIYLYEPALYPVSEVFTKEILKGVVEQMILESSLALLAARVMHLDRALEKSDELLRALTQEKHKVKKRLREKKQNAMIAKVINRFGSI